LVNTVTVWILGGFIHEITVIPCDIHKLLFDQDFMMLRFFVTALVLSICLGAVSAGAQTADPAAAQTVSWSVSASEAAVKPANALTFTLHAQIQKGWHVYGLKQSPAGPTPLLVSIEPNNIAAAGGAPVGSPPVKVHDPSFDLDTQIYSQAFSVTLPAHIASHPAAGHQSIPISVRFQTCNDRICQPPKTVRLSAPINVLAAN
jgi:DsbC/DsbD-like thiol-disulfide interchange protein